VSDQNPWPTSCGLRIGIVNRAQYITKYTRYQVFRIKPLVKIEGRWYP
jgi:hypothetical protein